MKGLEKIHKFRLLPCQRKVYERLSRNEKIVVMRSSYERRSIDPKMLNGYHIDLIIVDEYEGT